MRAAARRSWRWLSRFFGGTYPAVPSLRAELEQVRAQAQVPPVQERINSSSSTKELASVPTQRQQNLFNAQNEIREGEERLERLRAEAHSADHCWFQPPSRGCRKDGAPPFSGCGRHRCASAEGHGRLLARCVALGSDWTTSTISALVIVATQDQCDVDNTVLSDLSILPYEKKNPSKSFCAFGGCEGIGSGAGGDPRAPERTQLFEACRRRVHDGPRPWAQEESQDIVRPLRMDCTNTALHALAGCNGEMRAS